MSSCISGEDDDDWRGVWKDVDVVRHEMRTPSHGENFVAYIIEVTASDGTHWQVSAQPRTVMKTHTILVAVIVDSPSFQ